MAGFWCFLWMFCQSFFSRWRDSNRDSDDSEWLLGQTRQPSRGFPEFPGHPQKDGIIWGFLHQNPSKIQQNPINLQQKTPGGFVFWLIFYFAQKCWVFSTRGSPLSEFSGHGLVAPLPAHLSRGGLGLTPQAPAPTAPTAPAAADPVTLGNVGKLR